MPESERDKRHQLRSQLTWLGFGTVSAGVWIAPAHLLDETTDTLRRHKLDVYVELFRGEHLAFADTAQRVGQWWDLPRLYGLYQEFLDAYGPMAAKYRRRAKIEENQAFADYLNALTDWRRLSYADPGLPVKVLPSDWNGVAAARTFFELREKLAGPAHGLVDSVRYVEDGEALHLDQRFVVPQPGHADPGHRRVVASDQPAPDPADLAGVRAVVVHVDDVDGHGWPVGGLAAGCRAARSAG